ncbi:MAG: 2-C-methyl-D-erythritol 4-phosphate cytidylyltransferase [Acidobacteriaceae bacterium]|jgi:2-C-methyl-D-erythritol 4-phosphate cytidylyltransferase/2-C-methyl-D-erythritol 2,4-cyclodiphosphate synthase|nr:2-C-methyl-D-erythritol 4-phosphate cytidylyltransferase [Acidobacteriaceae bacterium]
MFVSAIIAAGGRGLRLGGAVPKQLLAVQGKPLLERSVDLFLGHPLVDEIVVALPAEFVDNPPPYLIGTRKRVRIVAGGARRQDSVARAFAAVDRAADIIVIHDAARPFASEALVERTIRAASESGAALAAMAARDTVKLAARKVNASAPSMVETTIPREDVYLAQTPQAFRHEVLREALALSERDVDATDEAMLAERAGYPVQLVEGESSNIKVTVPDDLPMADAIAREAGVEQPVVRVGTGYDLHRLVAGRPLVLGGVTIPFELGALGHSDADVVCHAATDAILGAAALGDIGRHFPDTDPQWKDASSLRLLAHAARLVRRHGYDILNVDVTVILERPKIKGFIDRMREEVARAVGIHDEAVSIKGKTNEGVDAVGRGEAVAAHAVAALATVRRPESHVRS